MKRDWLTVWRFPCFPDNAHATVVATRTKREAAQAIGMRSADSHHRIPANVTLDDEDVDRAMTSPGTPWVRTTGTRPTVWKTLVSFRMDKRLERSGRNT